MAQVPSELETVKAELAEPPVEVTPDITPDASLRQLGQTLAQVEMDLESARETVRTLTAEPQRRDTRRSEIREQIATTQQSLEETRTLLGALPVPGESPALTAARRTQLQASGLALEARIAFLEEERRDYDARRELLPLRRERWTRRVTQLEKSELACYS